MLVSLFYVKKSANAIIMYVCLCVCVLGGGEVVNITGIKRSANAMGAADESNFNLNTYIHTFIRTLYLRSTSGEHSRTMLWRGQVGSGEVPSESRPYIRSGCMLYLPNS